MRKIPISVAALGLAGFLAGPGHASFLDTDAECAGRGCVVIHDSIDYEYYHFTNPGTGGILPRSTKLTFPASNPIIGAGPVNALNTGTTTPASAPVAGEGLMLGVDQDGDGTPDLAIHDSGGEGFLDAGDSLGAFTLNSSSAIRLEDGRLLHSIYAASTRRFDIRARARVVSSSGDLSATVAPADIGVRFEWVFSGNDAGFAFGSAVAANPNPRRFNGCNDLGDLLAGYRRCFRVRRGAGTSGGAAPTIAEQSIRIDIIYTMPEYDMSQGTGGIEFEVELEAYRRGPE